MAKQKHTIHPALFIFAVGFTAITALLMVLRAQRDAEHLRTQVFDTENITEQLGSTRLPSPESFSDAKVEIIGCATVFAPNAGLGPAFTEEAAEERPGQNQQGAAEEIVHLAPIADQQYRAQHTPLGDLSDLSLEGSDIIERESTPEGLCVGTAYVQEARIAGTLVFTDGTDSLSDDALTRSAELVARAVASDLDLRVAASRAYPTRVPRQDLWRLIGRIQKDYARSRLKDVLGIGRDPRRLPLLYAQLNRDEIQNWLVRHLRPYGAETMVVRNGDYIARNKTTGATDLPTISHAMLLFARHDDGRIFVADGGVISPLRITTDSQVDYALCWDADVTFGRRGGPIRIERREICAYYMHESIVPERIEASGGPLVQELGD